MAPLAQFLITNKHTSSAAGLYLIASACKQLGPVWFPNHAPQFEITAEWLKSVAVTYGFAAAMDGRKKIAIDDESGNTNNQLKNDSKDKDKP